MVNGMSEVILDSAVSGLLRYYVKWLNGPNCNIGPVGTVNPNCDPNCEPNLTGILWFKNQNQLKTETLCKNLKWLEQPYIEPQSWPQFNGNFAI